MDEVSFTRSTLNLGMSKEALGVTPGCPARVGSRGGTGGVMGMVAGEGTSDGEVDGNK